jgi:6-phosphogluconolactonase
VLTELSNTVLAYEYNGGNVKLLQEISTLPEDFTGNSTCAAIHVSPDGKTLAASNRGADSIVIYKIQDNGALIFSSYIKEQKEPRDFRFSPDGKWLLIGNQNGDYVKIFKIENDNYVETSNISLPKPVCILFGGKI